MPVELFEQCVRERLANQVAAFDPPEVPALAFDRWVLASLLQKTIRRDEPEWALSAARSLLQLDPATLWRRLLVTAFEDVSFGDLGLVTEMLTARSKRWRASVTHESRFAAYFVDRLCKAPKCRAPNNLIEIAKYDPAFSASTRTLAFQPFDDVLARATSDLSPAARLSAAASLHGRSEDFEAHPEADPEPVCATLLSDASPALAYCVIEGLSATRLDHPLAMAVLSKAMLSPPFTTADDCLPPVSLVRGAPAYVFDMHTRAGASAIRSLVRQAPRLLSTLRSAGVPERRWFELVRHCIFDLETGLVKRRVVDPVSWNLRRHAETVGYGRTPENAASIMDAIVQSWPLYAKLRSSFANER